MLYYHAVLLRLLLLNLFSITICANEEGIRSLWTQNLTSSFPILELSKTIPRRNPKSHSLNAFFRHSWIIESPARQKHETFKNRSNSEILQQTKHMPQIDVKRMHDNHDTFLLVCLFFLKPRPRTLRNSIKNSFPSLSANSAISKFSGCGKIWRLNAAMDANLNIDFLDGWEPPWIFLFLMHVIDWCLRIEERKQGGFDNLIVIELQRGKQIVLVIGNDRVGLFKSWHWLLKKEGFNIFLCRNFAHTRRRDEAPEEEEEHKPQKNVRPVSVSGGRYNLPFWRDFWILKI